MKKILDNGHIMHYNNHCSAGVAHLVERDLAKVEVAGSNPVIRSIFFVLCLVFFILTGGSETEFR